jgi:predicted ATPase
MLLDIENVGILEKASIKLEGLTVIAGNNDTGKSTVGKLFFCIIKSLQKYEDNFEREKKENIEKYLKNIYLKIRRNSSENVSEIYRIFNPVYSYRQLKRDDISFFKKFENNIKELESDIKLELLELFKKMKRENYKELEKGKNIISTFEYYLKNEFKNNFSNIGNKKTKIVLREDNLDLLNLEMQDNNLEKAKVSMEDNITNIEDTTFIESPLILNNWDLIKETGENEIEIHNKDLCKKIEESKLEIDRKNGFYKKVKEIIEGEFFIEEKEYSNDLLKFKKNNLTLGMSTVATGIKSFGILDFLDKAFYLTENNFLILDEPEVHLHPAWQVKYAELIIYLIKERNLKILITSHSPYLIQALSKFSKEEKLENISSYYLTNKMKNGNVEIQDKTERLEEIFQKLSEPFEKLVWD